MPATHSALTAALHTVTHATGVVISVYFAQEDDPDAGHAIVADTVAMFLHEVADPAAICLSVDGPGPGIVIARRIAVATGVQVVEGPVNRGKFSAVALGMRRLLDNPALRYFAAVDQDGDHFANDLLNFIRAGEHVLEQTGDDNILVMGNRTSRHRSLGFLRGEQEELANRILLDALNYDAARRGAPLRLQYLTTTDALPDFHAGYKVFSRAAAHAVFDHEPSSAGLPESAALRHAIEAVMVVEAHLTGATLAAINRRTFDEQPISHFAAFNRARLHADLILWPCLRLDIPGHFVAQWLDNHVPALLLGTLAPQGQDELRAIRDLVLAEVGIDPATRPAAFTRPRFV